MSKKIAAADLPYIVKIANRAGCMAVIENRKVALFTPVLTEADEGFHHVGFHINRVRTIEEARGVLKSVKAGRLQLEEHGHHFGRPAMTAAAESA
jgi:hypothetical protein